MCPYCHGKLMKEQDRLSGEGVYDDDAYGLDRHYECSCHTDKKVLEIQRLLESVQQKVFDLIEEEGSLEELLEWMGKLDQEDVDKMIKE